MHKNIPLVVGITILFLGTCITPSVANDNVKKSSIPISNGNTLYVGGSGEGNYSKIQDAIDNASDGDTVFVFNGIYYENVKMDKTINLIGEDKNTTVIDGKNIDNVIKINKKYTLIEDFSITSSGYESYDTSSGIFINSNNTTVKNCDFFNNCWALKIIEGSNNTVKNNDFHENWRGILIQGEGHKIIKNRLKKTNGSTIVIWGKENLISGNIIINNGWEWEDWGDAITVYGNNNLVTNNHIAMNMVGINCDDGYGNKIEKNNIIFNLIQAGDAYEDYPSVDIRNTWDKNYWNRPRILPKVIRGRWWMTITIPPAGWFQIPIPMIVIDWHPAKEPYDI